MHYLISSFKCCFNDETLNMFVFSFRDRNHFNLVHRKARERKKGITSCQRRPIGHSSYALINYTVFIILSWLRSSRLEYFSIQHLCFSALSLHAVLIYPNDQISQTNLQRIFLLFFFRFLIQIILTGKHIRYNSVRYLHSHLHLDSKQRETKLTIER